jgi:hypothetical protein
VAYALRLIESRRSVGKETEICLRGVVVSEEKLKRYVQRSKVIPEENTSAPSAVIACTPPCEEGSPFSISSSPKTSTSDLPPELSAPFLGDGSQTTTRSDSELPLTRKRPLSTQVDDRLGSRNAVAVRVPPASAYSFPQFVAYSASAPFLPTTSLPQQARPALRRTFGSTSVTTTETFLNLDCGSHGQKASQILMSRKARGFQMLCRLCTWVLILACAGKQIQLSLSSAWILHFNSFATASMRSVHASLIKPTVRSRRSCLSSFRCYLPACSQLRVCLIL